MSEFSLSSFAGHLLEMAGRQLEVQHHALDRAASIVEKAAKAKIGEYQDAAGQFPGWAELADSTKSDRVAQGYPENEPGLRSGEMRDSIEHVAGLTEAHIGSNDDKMVYFELGSEKQPPRSVLGGAAVDTGEKVIAILGAETFAALMGKDVVNGLLPID
jgi:hypothetical protein